MAAQKVKFFQTMSLSEMENQINAFAKNCEKILDVKYTYSNPESGKIAPNPTVSKEVTALVLYKE